MNAKEKKQLAEAARSSRLHAYLAKNQSRKVGGVTILMQKPSCVEGWDVILAMRDHNGEFVVWNYCPEDEVMQSGRYFSGNLPAALKCYEEAR